MRKEKLFTLFPISMMLMISNGLIMLERNLWVRKLRSKRSVSKLCLGKKEHNFFEHGKFMTTFKPIRKLPEGKPIKVKNIPTNIKSVVFKGFIAKN